MVGDGSGSHHALGKRGRNGPNDSSQQQRAVTESSSGIAIDIPIKRRRIENGGEEDESPTHSVAGCNPRGAKKTRVQGLVDPLFDILRSLTRWVLDAIPLVSRQFRSVANRFFQQRRVFTSFNYSPELPMPVSMLVDSEVVAFHPSAFANYQRQSHTGDLSMIEGIPRNYLGRAHTRFDMTKEEFLAFHRDTPSLRFFNSTLAMVDSEGDADGVAAEMFEWARTHLSTIWESHTLTIFNSSETILLRVPISASLLGNCNSLSLEGYSIEWTGAALGEPASGTRRCSKILIGNDVRGDISLEHVTNYLFSALDDDDGDGGEKRLRVFLDLRNLEWQPTNGTSLRLMQLLKERLKNVSPRVPSFFMWAPEMRADGEANTPNDELLPQGNKPSDASPELASRCFFNSYSCPVEGRIEVAHVEVDCRLKEQLEISPCTYPACYKCRCNCEDPWEVFGWDEQEEEVTPEDSSGGGE